MFRPASPGSRKALRIILIAAGILIFAKLLLLFAPYKALNEFKNHSYNTLVLDRNGYIIQELPLENGLRREFCPIENIPKQAERIFLTAEDKRFYFHFGVDFFSICRAAFQNKAGCRYVSGASTITMQLARMISPSPNRNFSAKIRDSVNAVRIEGKLSKRRILELYLNNVPFGKNTEGIASAAKIYFGKPVSKLTEEEFYLLAVIPRSPGLYNPVENPENCAKAASKLSNKVEYDTLLKAARDAGTKNYKYARYMNHYIHFLKNNFAESLKNPRVNLSADLKLQLFAEKTLNQALLQAQESRIQNGAVLVLNVQTGEILAWVGSNNWYDKEHSGQIDGILNRMQPGSSIKPFLYALALEDGIIEPSSVLADIPMEFGSENLYIPANFNNRFNGPIRTRVALASSLNIPAVRLLEQTGVENLLLKLNTLGFKSLKENGETCGLSLALGGCEVSLYEMTTGFATFAADGKLIKPGEKEVQVWQSDISRIICSFLSDKKARALGFGFTQTFDTPYPSIFKTGTSNQYQNITALGATPRYAVGVWMGNFNGNTVIGKTGSSLPAWVARTILDRLESQNETYETKYFEHSEKTFSNCQTFQQPADYHLEKVCSLSGMAPTDACRDTVSEYVKNGKKLEPCTWHNTDADGKITITYPARYQQWAALYSNEGSTRINYASEKLSFHSPRQGSIYYFDPGQSALAQVIPVEIFGGAGDTCTILLDGTTVYEQSRPFSVKIKAVPGKHKIKAVCNSETAVVEFEVR